MSDLTTTLLFTVGYVLLILAVPLLVIFLLERFYRALIDPQDEELPITDLGSSLPPNYANAVDFQVETSNPEAKAFIEKELRKALDDGTLQERVNRELLEGNWEVDNVYDEPHPVDYRYSPRIRPSDVPNTLPTPTEPQNPPPAS